MTTEQFEKVSVNIFELGQEDLICKIQEVKLSGGNRLDFTQEYLLSLPIDYLRHILMGAMSVLV